MRWDANKIDSQNQEAGVPVFEILISYLTNPY